MKHFIKYFLIFVIITDLFLIGVFGVFAREVSTPVNSANTQQTQIEIQSGQGVAEIAKLLKSHGLIKNQNAFVVYTVLEGKSTVLKAGTYKLSPSMSTKHIVDVLSGEIKKSVATVTIPEGFTSKQIATRLLAEGVLVEEGEFLSKVSQNNLEGFLFPDTYEFTLESTTDVVLNKFLTNFEARTGTKPVAGGEFYNILIMASILEREVQTEVDMRIAAGVLYNRLDINMALQVDASLTYITGKTSAQLTQQDLQMDSPFNTYRYRGLPPAPISNPGLKAINAAQNPADTDYFYYLSDKDGNTHFSRTLEEHNTNKQTYLR